MQDLEGFFDSFPPNQMNFNLLFSRLGQAFGQQAVKLKLKLLFPFAGSFR